MNNAQDQQTRLAELREQAETFRTEREIAALQREIHAEHMARKRLEMMEAISMQPSAEHLYDTANEAGLAGRCEIGQYDHDLPSTRNHGQDELLFSTDTELAWMRGIGRVLHYLDMTAVGAVGKLINYTIGTGFDIEVTAKVDHEEMLARVAEQQAAEQEQQAKAAQQIAKQSAQQAAKQPAKQMTNAGQPNGKPANGQPIREADETPAPTGLEAKGEAGGFNPRFARQPVEGQQPAPKSVEQQIADDPKTKRRKEIAKAANKVWDEFAKCNQWRSLQRELFLRNRRDGEWFLRVAYDDKRECIDAEVIEPAHVVTPENDEPLNEVISEKLDWTFGIGTRPNRHDIPVAYYVQREAADQTTEWFVYEAEEITHRKSNTDRNVKRGVTDFYAMAPLVEVSFKITRNAGHGAAVQAAIAYIREWVNPTTPGQINSNLTGSTAVTQYNRTQGAVTQRVQTLGPGSVVDTFGANYHAGPMGQQHTPAIIEVNDGVKRHYGNFWSMPGWMITNDASATTAYSSALVSESPFVRACEAEQEDYVEVFTRIVTRVLSIAAERGEFKEWNIKDIDALLEEIEINVERPSVGVRNKVEENTIYEKLHGKNAISLRTWVQKMGLDYEQEQVLRLAEPKATDPMVQQGQALAANAKDAMGARKPGASFFESSQLSECGDDGDCPCRKCKKRAKKKAKKNAAKKARKAMSLETLIRESVTTMDCGANAEGGGGFQPGNTCAQEDGSGGDTTQSGGPKKPVEPTKFDPIAGDADRVQRSDLAKSSSGLIALASQRQKWQKQYDDITAKYYNADGTEKADTPVDPADVASSETIQTELDRITKEMLSHKEKIEKIGNPDLQRELLTTAKSVKAKQAEYDQLFQQWMDATGPEADVIDKQREQAGQEMKAINAKFETLLTRAEGMINAKVTGSEDVVAMHESAKQSTPKMAEHFKAGIMVDPQFDHATHTTSAQIMATSQTRGIVKRQVVDSVAAQVQQVATDDELTDGATYLEALSNSSVAMDASKLEAKAGKYREANAGRSAQHKASFVTQSILDAWSSSSTNDPVSVAVQELVAQEFGTSSDMQGVTMFESDRDARKMVDHLKDKAGPAIKHAIRAMYQDTQKQLADAGIEEVVLYRGMRLNTKGRGAVDGLDQVMKTGKGRGVAANATLDSNPLSSWSIDYATAKSFADNGKVSALTAVKVHRSQIFSTARTGVGCLTEAEVVLLGDNHVGKTLLMPDSSTSLGSNTPEGMPNSSTKFWRRFNTSIQEAMQQADEMLQSIRLSVDADPDNANWSKRTPDAIADLQKGDDDGQGDAAKPKPPAPQPDDYEDEAKPAPQPTEAKPAQLPTPTEPPTPRVGETLREAMDRQLLESATTMDCGANAQGGGGFQPGNTCAAGQGSHDAGGTRTPLVQSADQKFANADWRAKLGDIPDVAFRNATPDQFLAAQNGMKRSAYLTQHDASTLQKIIADGGRLYLSEDGKTGYVLTGGKDLQNLFNNGGIDGSGKAALLHAIQSGAETLDCFDGFLPRLYNQFGFRPYMAYQFDDQYAPEGWNYERDGRPDVVFMQYKGPRDVTAIRSKIGAAKPFISPGRVEYGVDIRATSPSWHGLAESDQAGAGLSRLRQSATNSGRTGSSPTDGTDLIEAERYRQAARLLWEGYP